jgi:restriction system protein
LGNKYALLDNDGDMIAKQYPTGVGPIDILARSKDSKEWLVIELKKGRSGDQLIIMFLNIRASCSSFDPPPVFSLF